MMPANRPAIEWRVRVVTSKHSPLAVVGLHTLDREGQEVRLWSQPWETGRPSPAQLRDLVARVSEDLESTVVTIIGVQGLAL